MTKQYQITLMCNNGQYRPVSCLISCEAIDLTNKEQKLSLIRQGAQKICFKRLWTKADLKRYGYITAKVREYNKDKIAAEAKARYDAIKEAHYKDGSWKRPKTKS